jgi:hypothetical protein
MQWPEAGQLRVLPNCWACERRGQLSRLLCTYQNRYMIKRRLLDRGVPEVCAGCGLGPEWNGQPLTLQLDHLNGVHNDNRPDRSHLPEPSRRPSVYKTAYGADALPGELQRLSWPSWIRTRKRSGFRARRVCQFP